jgi:hypothetical protein
LDVLLPVISYIYDNSVAILICPVELSSIDFRIPFDMPSITVKKNTTGLQKLRKKPEPGDGM